MPVIPPLPYTRFLEQADTCDVVIFSGRSDTSIAIETATGGAFSHTAMVVVAPDGTKLLWQAAGETIEVDPIKGAKHTGAQLGPLDATMRDLIFGFRDAPVYRQLSWDRPADLTDRLWKVLTSLDSRPFPDTWKLIEEYGAGAYLGLEETTGPMFCSELVAFTYQGVGLLDDPPPANAYSPTDFSSTSTSSLRVEPVVGEFAVDVAIADPPS